MHKRPLVLPTLTLLTLSITSHFALAEINKGKVPIVTPECSDIAVCKHQGIFTNPFEEPLVTGEFLDQNNTNITNPLNNYPDNGKCEENEDGVLKCKPAAGSLALRKSLTLKLKHLSKLLNKIDRVLTITLLPCYQMVVY